MVRVSRPHVMALVVIIVLAVAQSAGAMVRSIQPSATPHARVGDRPHQVPRTDLGLHARAASHVAQRAVPCQAPADVRVNASTVERASGARARHQRVSGPESTRGGCALKAPEPAQQAEPHLKPVTIGFESKWPPETPIDPLLDQLLP